MRTENIIVVIATSMRRTDYLLNRSLRSVYLQEEVAPLHVVIVDDNVDEDEHQKIRAGIENLRMEMNPLWDVLEADNEGLFRTTLVKNRRTKGKSGTGAWNTGAEIAREYQQGSTPGFLAFLDDDDRWLPSYLKICWEAVENSWKAKPIANIVAVVASLRRIEPVKSEEMKVSVEKLTREAFFIGNPGWQGSNTFVSLKAFWECGAFDERMASTNDRDLAIRLMEYCEDVEGEILAISQVLVEHFAHGGDRVTTNPEGKRAGLDIFYMKYLDLMSPEVRRESLARSKKLFNYSPNAPENLD